MTQTLHPTLIAAPEVSFAELRRQFAALGWQLESRSEEPILPGEPELATLVHGEDATVLHYTFNPAVRFRVLQFRGPNAEGHCAQASGRIASIDLARLRALLASIGVRRVLLGLFAAQESGELGVIDVVSRLRSHEDLRIARTAVRVHESLLSRLRESAVQSQQEQVGHRERPARFCDLTQPELRKQTLRWLMRDERASNRNIDQILHDALHDDDPEVRVTAVLAAARLGATNLVAALRATNIPTSTSAGAYERDRFFYEKLRQTAVGYLSMNEGEYTAYEADKRTQFRRAIGGELEVRDDVTLLLHALTTPVELGDRPTRLPEAIEDRDSRYILRKSGIALRWVAPIPHWLGEDFAPDSLHCPIRRTTPRSGFFIAELPVDPATAVWSLGSQRQLSESSTGQEPFLCSCDEATHMCEWLSQVEGIQIELPSGDQWEMAARGPDGRRYTWGNCLKQSGSQQPSPWMVRNMTSHAYEWTQDVLDDRTNGSFKDRIVCGGRAAPACSRRHSIKLRDGEHPCALRPVLNWAAR